MFLRHCLWCAGLHLMLCFLLSLLQSLGQKTVIQKMMGLDLVTYLASYLGLYSKTGTMMVNYSGFWMGSYSESWRDCWRGFHCLMVKDWGSEMGNCLESLRMMARDLGSLMDYWKGSQMMMG